MPAGACWPSTRPWRDAPRALSPILPRVATTSGSLTLPSEQARALQRRAHRLIPGGAHTYAKADDQYPVNAPPLLVRGKGARVWDSDGREFIEYGGGMRANVLGHAHPAVVEAVADAVAAGTNFVRPSVLEGDTAEDLLDFIGRPGWMAKFAKNGSDANGAAIRLARAATGRDLIAFCHDQPFFSVEDWFIGSTPMSAGVPEAVRSLTTSFPYGDLGALSVLLERREVAAIVLEAAKYTGPPEGYLAGVRELCDRTGTVFVLDECITGVRWPGGSALACYDVQPDLACYGKALGNGISVSALTGRRELMEPGALDPDGPRVFLASYTHGAEHTGLAAARAVLRVSREVGLGEELARRGEDLARRLNAVSEAHGVLDHFDVFGLGQNLVFRTADIDGNPSQVMRALAMEQMVAAGVLGPSLVNSLGHGAEESDRTESAWERVCSVYAAALDDGPEPYLHGHPTRPVFR